MMLFRMMVCFGVLCVALSNAYAGNASPQDAGLLSITSPTDASVAGYSRSRSLLIAPDGSLSRHRSSVGLWPIADCPVLSASSTADYRRIADFLISLGPPHSYAQYRSPNFSDASADTREFAIMLRDESGHPSYDYIVLLAHDDSAAPAIVRFIVSTFDSALEGCPVLKGAAADGRPGSVRWLLQFKYGGLGSKGSLEIDSDGRVLFRLGRVAGTQDRRLTLAADEVRKLDPLVSAVLSAYLSSDKKVPLDCNETLRLEGYKRDVVTKRRDIKPDCLGNRQSPETQALIVELRKISDRLEEDMTSGQK